MISAKIVKEPQTITLADNGGHSSMDFDVRLLAFSPDGQWFAAQANDNHMRIWDTDQLGVSPLLIETYASRELRFSPDGRYLATISGESEYSQNEIEIWEAGNWEVSTSLVGHEDIVWSLDFSSDGQILVSASGDDTARLWFMADLQFGNGD